MVTPKRFWQQQARDTENTYELIIGESAGVLPQRFGSQGFWVTAEEETLTFRNEKLNICHHFRFADFTQAKFGIGAGQLWLQCLCNGLPLIFRMRRSHWKSEKGKRLIRKFEKQLGISLLNDKNYKGYTGKLFFLYALK